MGHLILSLTWGAVYLQLAMKIGWTMNVVIMEAELIKNARHWYLQKANAGGLSKTDLLGMIESAAHLEISLDESRQDWYTKENNDCSEKIQHEKDPVYLPRQDLPGMMKSLKSSHKPRF